MNVLILIIFVVTYVLIATRRLSILPIGRPAGAALGAVLMVAVGALTPEAAFKAVSYDTLLLLLGMMVLVVYLARAGFFTWATALALRSTRSPLALLLVVAWLAGGLSAFLVNDTVCLFMTPMVVQLCARARLPPGPFLIALATSANIGSAATLVGNPQNMLIGAMSGVGFGRFLACSGVAAVAGMVVNSALLVLYYRRALGGRLPEAEGEAAVEGAPVEGGGGWGRWVVLGVLGGVVVAFFAGAHLGWAAMTGAVAVMLVERRDPGEVLKEVDWSLLLFFSGLFVVVAGLDATGWIEASWEALAPRFALDGLSGLAAFTGALVVGSNLVSNVPMVLLTGPHLDALGEAERGWVLLAFVTTIAGNLTLVGSVANLIVAEGARSHYELGFGEYLRFGVVSTAAVLVVGVPLITWMT